MSIDIAWAHVELDRFLELTELRPLGYSPGDVIVFSTRKITRAA
ncbi:hypothetical protein ACGFXC_02240 [Streptomyces sp. NPDC048507]